MSELLHDPIKAVGEFIAISTSVSTERDIDRLLNMIVASACRIARADSGLIYVLDSTKQFLNVVAVYSNSVTPKVSEFESIALMVNGERNFKRLAAYSAFSGKLTNIPDIYDYTGFGFDDIYTFDRKYNYRTQSVLALPLKSHDNLTIGILQLINCTDPGNNKISEFPEAIESIVNAFASQAAVAIDNAQLIEKNKRLITVLDATNKKLEEENKALREKIQTKYDFTRIIGSGPAMQHVFNLMKKIFNSDTTVLLGGQTGTGKELIAQTIHYNSNRRKAELVAQNCAALPETLLESELFGFKKGAFSGANNDKKGLIEMADGGTLFLDEIGDMPISLQAKLLRVLQEKEVRPLGALTPKKVNIRVIAATHCDLMQKIKDGEFREDLYYRLSVFPITLPSLTERREDIPGLLQYFLAKFTGSYGKNIKGFSPTALDILMQYEYPGNIRELRNVVERAVLLAEEGGSILEQHLPDKMIVECNDSSINTHDEQAQSETTNLDNVDISGGLRDAVDWFEAAIVRKKLDECQWNQTQAAEALKIGRRTLIEKMKRYNLKREHDSVTT